MNPQYMPPQQFGGPPQSFPPNRASPALGPQQGQVFQNVPLGPPKPGQGPGGPPQGRASPSHIPPSGAPGGMPAPGMPLPGSMVSPQGSTGLPPTSTSGQFLHSMGPPSIGGSGPRSHIPSSQLPPSQMQNPGEQRPPQTNPFGPPQSKPDMPPTSIQNGPPQFQNGPPQFQNGPSTGQQSAPPNGPGRGQFGQPLLPGGPPFPNQNIPPRPGSNQPSQFGQSPLPGGPPSSQQHGQIGVQGGPPSTQFGQPGGPPSGQFGQPGGPPIHQFGQQLSGQPPQLGSPPSASFGQPGKFGPANAPSNQPGGVPSGLGQPPNQFGQPPNVGGPPFINQPPLQSAPPMGQPPLPGPPRPGQPMPQSFAGQPPMPGQPPMTGHPPLPGQAAPGNFNQPPGQFPGQFPPGPGGPQMPPLPGQYNQQSQFNGPNQLTNQMQNMNIGGQRQFSGGPMKGAVNGETGPHMPPPLNHPSSMNGQQIRGPQGPGFPPTPGQGNVPSGPGAYPQPNYQQPQQNRRLDPDQMPSPIQVTQDDQQNRSGTFVTNQKGLVPPLVTTNFVVQDQGNSSPRYIRSTMYNVPISHDIVKQTAVPFSLVISPMARTIEQEYPPPIVNFGELGPIRCIRCKVYMCPYMQFIDSGRRFQCLFCRATTDVPTEYFQHLDHTGQRMDRYERPELILGTYEFVATADYCRNNTLPKPPAVIFVIDVSYNNIKSGLVHLLCAQMKEIIQNLPVDQGQEKSNMRIGFITYNNSVHFYNIKGTLAAPQMMVVGDVQEMFMPLLDGFLCTPEESGPVIDALMQQIPAMFGDTRETETVLLPAIQAGLEALKASECSGKLLVFHSTLPSAEAPGKLKNRDDRKLLGTEKERTVLTPQNQVYNQLGQDCVGAGCSVDLFIFNNSYIDIATIGQVSRLTGGEIFKYTYFQADLDGERLINDIITDISRPIAFDAVMRVRTSTGIRPTDFYGHFYMSNTTDMELAAIDCDKAVAVEIKHDDKLSEEEGVYIQTALLYTSCSGQRRLRIINLSLKTCSQMADLYRSCDLDTIINYISKQAVYKLLDNNPKAVKDSIVNRAAQVLATYRKNCASPSSAGQLILPECMKLLPLYVNCLLKSDALSGGSDMTLDDRSFVMQSVMIMDIPTSVHYFYPRLIPLHDLDPSAENVAVPAPIRCTFEKMSEQGVYILENGIHMFLWFGLGVNPDFIQKVFGAPSAIQVDIERIGLPELDNPLSLAVRTIVEEIRIQRHRCMRLTLVRQREKLEPIFKHFLVEDRGTDGSPSYVDFLCHMHKEIRALLS